MKLAETPKYPKKDVPHMSDLVYPPNAPALLHLYLKTKERTIPFNLLGGDYLKGTQDESQPPLPSINMIEGMVS